MHWALPKFVHLNEYFQSERVIITALYNKVCKTYKTLLASYLNSNYINHNDLADINPNLCDEFLNLINMYLGVEVKNHLNKLNDTEKKRFLFKNVVNFLLFRAWN